MESLRIIAEALQEECGIDPARLTPQTNLLEDLELDSLDLLNASFVIERLTGTKIPVQSWIQEEYGDAPPAESWFVVSSIQRYIEARAA